MRSLVVGGLGFVGRKLVYNLLDYGPVAVLDDGSNPNSHIPNGWFNRLDVVTQDVTERESWEHIWTTPRFDVVFYLACTQQLDSFHNPGNSIMVDLWGVQKALDYCRYNGSRMIYTSSVSVEGEFNTPYSICKDAGEKMCKFYRDVYGVKVSIVRYSNVYGPGNANGVIGKFLRAGDVVEVAGDGSLTRDFTFVDDAVRVTRLMVDLIPEDPISIGTGKETSIAYVAKLLGKQIKSRPITYKDYPLHRVVDTSRLKEVIATPPATSIEDGIKETIRRWEIGEE